MFLSRTAFLITAKKDPLFETTFSELKAGSDSARVGRSKSILTYFVDIGQGPDGQARTAWRVPSQTTRGTEYKVTVAIIVPKLTLFGIAKRKWDAKTFPGILRAADVKVHCTCADFLFGGPKYNLGVGQYAGSLEPLNTGYRGEKVLVEPPDIRDPNREHLMCKHCIAVSSRFTANGMIIMKAAKDFVMQIEPNDELAKGEQIPLAKDVELIGLGKQQKNEITEGIIRGGEDLSKQDLEKDQEPSKQEEETILEKEPVELQKDAEETEELVPEVEPKEEPVEELELPAKVDSDLNNEENKPELEKDKETEEELQEEVEDILDRPEEDVKKKLEKDKEEV